MRCTIVEQMRPERPGESDAMLAAPHMYRPPGSVLLYDVVGKTLLEAPFLQTTIEFMQSSAHHGFSAAIHRAP
jgi:hypothetical protein